jgi:hypothetical protein
LARRSSSIRGRVISHPASQAMLIRQIHAYLSVFVAPTILFFAFTGSLQLFGLHEAHGDYRPPALIEKLGKLHTEQRFAQETPKDGKGGGKGDRAAPSAMAARDAERDAEGPPPIRELALKSLFLAAALTLIASTLLGLWMALTLNRRKIVLALLFAIGVAAPVALVML